MNKTVDPIILAALRCPICNCEITLRQGDVPNGGASLVCQGKRKHCYDIASSGYVNLMPPGHTNGGDSKQAVRARSDFLNLELYRPVADALADALCRHIKPQKALLIDAGCGEGYYTEILSQKGFSCAGVDLSRHAAEAAAKRASKTGNEDTFFAVSSVFGLPFADNSATALTNVFAPCAETEFTRVLRTGGILAVVYAGPEHLMGLKQAIYEQTKQNDGRADLPTHLKLLEETRVRFNISVNGTQNLQNLFAMTPYYWKTSPTDSEKLKSIEELVTTVDMIIALYQKPNDSVACGAVKEDTCKFL